MSLIDVLDETKRWAEERLFPLFEDALPWSEVHPPVDLFPVLGPQGIEDAICDSSSREIIDTLRGYLAATPDDVAVRWTVLAFLYFMGKTYDKDEDDYNIWEPSDRKRFREELSAMVRLVEVSRLSDPKTTRWEIINACMVSDFERAERLYERLAELDCDRQAQHWAVRAQFHFLRSLTQRERNTLVPWIAALFPASSNPALQLARWAVGLDEAIVDSGGAGPHLRDAAHFFQKSLDAGFELPSLHQAALARCLLVDGHYARAAENYRAVLSRGLVLQGDNARHNDELGGCLYVAAADAVKRANDAAAAKTLLRECVEKHPRHADAWLRLAELYAGEAKYEDAYKVLDQWADKQPELESDIWVKTLRALGRLEKPRDWRRVLDEFFNNHPERLEAVRETVDSHWGVLKELGEESRKEWLYGCFRLWWATPGYESVHYPDVVHHFAVAVEIELRERLFRPFMEEAKKSRELLESVRQRTDERAKRWRRWLEGVDFKGTLSDMLHEVDPSRKCSLLPWQKLQDWLQGHHANLRNRFWSLKTDRLNDLRNPAIHRAHPQSKTDALEACRLCQAFLTALLSKS